MEPANIHKIRWMQISVATSIGCGFVMLTLTLTPNPNLWIREHRCLTL